MIIAFVLLLSALAEIACLGSTLGEDICLVLVFELGAVSFLSSLGAARWSAIPAGIVFLGAVGSLSGQSPVYTGGLLVQISLQILAAALLLALEPGRKPSILGFLKERIH
jgi:hypothetical protein